MSVLPDAPMPGPAGPGTPGAGSARTSRSKAEEAYRVIRAAILDGQLPPGSAIDKPALCARLGLSRFPVGAALNRLAFERLVDVQPQRGSFVARIGAAEARELMHVRRGIEMELSALAASSCPGEAVEGLARTLRYAEAAAGAGDAADFHRLDLAFHAQLADGLGFRNAAAILDSIRTRVDRVRRLMLPVKGRMQATLDEHRAILAAVEARDAERARAAMGDHLQRVLDQFEDFTRERPGLFAP